MVLSTWVTFGIESPRVGTDESDPAAQDVAMPPRTRPAAAMTAP